MAAARLEGAARRQAERVRHIARDAEETLPPPAGAVDARDRIHEPARVGHAGAREDLPHVALLHRLARVHDDDAVRDLGHHAEIMGDEEDRHAELALQPAHQVEDLGLDGDVERRRRLVGDEEPRPAAERHRDHRPLPHAAGHLVRIALGAAGGSGMPTSSSISTAARQAALPSLRWCSATASAI